MLTSPAPITITSNPTTSTTAARPSRLRGLSYLRNYTHDRLHSSRADAPPLTRAISSPAGSPVAAEHTHTPVVNSAEHSMARNRASTTSGPTPTAEASKPDSPTIRFIPHVETRTARPSLHFAAITKTLKSSNGIIRVGRYTEREQTASQDEVTPIGFKSKVVSRRHCEFWCNDGQWYVKDVRSSSGTFLNHVRLSSPGVESRPYPVNDGDVVQLGIDFKGGEEVIFRCVKIRIECNRGWQKALNNFNTTTHKKLLKSVAGKSRRDSDTASVNNHECSICLNPVTPCQCLFVAPCSHVWHYKCVRELVHGPNWPNFLCPNCRFVADLEADVEPPEQEEEWESVNGEAEEQNQVEGSTDEVVGGAGESTQSDILPPDEEIDRTSSRSQPVDIALTPKRDGIEPEHDRIGIGSNTPGSSAAFALAAGMVADGLLTPRNDAGPFIFDGSAGRAERH